MFRVTIPFLFCICACSGTGGGVTPDGTEDPCNSGGEAFVSLTAMGGLVAVIDWFVGGTGDQQIACGSVGTGDVLDMGFVGEDAGGEQMTVNFRIADLQAGDTGAFSGDIVIAGVAGLFSSTDESCDFDISNHEQIGDDAVVNGAWLVEGTAVCSGVTDLFGTVEVTVEDISFAGLGVYLSL